MTYLLFITAFSLSSIAAYYSIVGLMTIFAAAPMSIAIMGTALEVAKIVTVSWLHRNWKSSPLLLKSYFCSAVIILMIITSLGIFGYLSRAHSEQTASTADISSKVSFLDEKIKISKENIDASRKALKQLDEAVDQIMARSTTETGADKAVQVRRQQSRERTRLLQEIETEQKTIAKLVEERNPIASEVRKIEAEVGPVKYIASFVYGESSPELLEKSVTWMILLLIIVFDPLAVLLFIAFNRSLDKRDKIIETNQVSITKPNTVLYPEIHYTQDSQDSKSNLVDKSVITSRSMKLSSSTSTVDKILIEKIDNDTGVRLRFDFDDVH